ncbi:MAG TPA: polyprenyl synthetase family protein [Myxococcaceae bacterium]|nr:polyprenyl synthetase family protein [Myxococcaceae bacterium]
MNQMETTPEAARFLEAAEARLVSVLSHGSGEVAQSDTLLNAGRHLCVGSGGKRVRPTMVHLFGLAAGAPETGLLNVAVAAELVHSASLLHDDVVDAGMYRRGRPTVNALWGNVVAVMGGDLLLTLALDELAPLDREITFAAVRTVAEMTRATIGEVEARGDLSLPVERFRGIMEGKTGALFGFCGASAGRLAGRDEAARRFETFGRHLGVAFQIADDLKDLNGGDPGKPVFADFKSRTPSLPILLAAQMDEPLRRRIKDLWAFGSMADERVRELGTAVLATDAPRAALTLMDREIEAALDALGPLRDSPGANELTDWARRLGAAFR